MKFVHKFDRSISVIFFITIITVVFTSYFTFKEIINSHNKLQQQAIVPLFTLVTSEIIRPLTVASFMANDQFVINYAKQEHIDKEVLLSYLHGIAKNFNMTAFIALENHGIVLDSTNKESLLNLEQAEWYFRLKDLTAEQFTDIGNAENPHLYFDKKLRDNQQNFLGFTGVSVDLDHFAHKFKAFQDRFGFEVFFVDENGVITLSSSHLMKTTSHHRKNELINISDLPWYPSYLNHQKNLGKEQDFINMQNDEFIVSKMPVQDLNWTMYIVSPPSSKQSEYWLLFLSRFGLFLLVSLLLHYALTRTLGYFKTNLVKDAKTDFLTKLPNRSFIHWHFDELIQKHHSISLVIADIDNFKQVNDTYGHLVGDDVLKFIANKLNGNLRQHDITGRWGGEEFIMLLPDTNAQQALEIVERIREKIANTPFHISSVSKNITTTVSFGISHQDLATTTLKNLLVEADKALYKAKANGRNQAVIHHT